MYNLIPKTSGDQIIIDMALCDAYLEDRMTIEWFLINKHSHRPCLRGICMN